MGFDLDLDPFFELLEPPPFPPPFASAERTNWRTVKSEARRRVTREDMVTGESE